MGIYSESLLNRYNTDRRNKDNSKDALLNNLEYTESKSNLGKVEQAIIYILNKFEIEPVTVRGCKNTDEMLEAMADPESVMYERINIHTDVWQNGTNYVLAFLENDTPVIITKSLFGHHYFIPSDKTKGILTKKLVLKEKAYVIYRPLGKGRFSLFEFICLMTKMISPADIPAIAAATLAITLLAKVTPSVNKQVLGDLLNEGTAAYATLFGLLITYVTAALARGAINIVKSTLLGRMKLRISNQMQVAVMAKVLLMPYSYFVSTATGKLSRQIKNGKQLSDTIVDFVMNNFLSAIFALAYIPQMKELAPALVLPAVIVMIIQMTASVAFCFMSANNAEQVMATQQASDEVQFEIFKGIQKIQNIGAQNRAFTKLANNYNKVLSATKTPPILIRLSGTILTYISSLGTLVVLFLAVPKGVNRTDYIAFTSSFSLLATTVGSLVSMSKAIISMRPLLKQMHILFDYVDDTPKGTEYVQKLNGEIDIQDLYFSYNGNPHGCVDGISLHINPGEKIALVGESGCGKSTLLKLLLGMINPVSGTILYDKRNLSTLNARSLRKKIGSVFQFSNTIPGSIYDNIVYCAPNATEEDVWTAATQAAIADDIRALPMGMETEISEGNNGGFSGGQRQRMMLARAFAMKPSLLILDEATSALDNITQKAVLDAVYEMKCTVIMVAHRLSTVVGCDRIIMLKDGRIVEEGNYEYLMSLNGEFATLVKKQQIDEELM